MVCVCVCVCVSTRVCEYPYLQTCELLPEARVEVLLLLPLLSERVQLRLGGQQSVPLRLQFLVSLRQTAVQLPRLRLRVPQLPAQRLHQ